VTSYGLGKAIYPKSNIFGGTEAEAFVALARWVGGTNVSFFGSVAGFMTNTQERPRGC
jgi:hypothetical protein